MHLERSPWVAHLRSQQRRLAIDRELSSAVILICEGY
jgi:hypothetical protein